ncbi:MAG: ABC transporter substrate-binding protein [Alphaproteobacteria bacterium]
MRRALLLAAAVIAAIAAPAAAQRLTAVQNADIRSSNPGVNRDDNTDQIILHVVEGLVGYAEDGTVGPLLAESVAASADGLTYTFKLRSGVKFHNGAEMTSADVLWTWNRYMDPKTEWRCLTDFDGRQGLKVVSATAPDASTFVMVLNKPNALFLDSLARTDCAMTGIIHRDSVKADGSWDKPIGTGPFTFGEWRRGQFVTLNAFEGYVSPKGDKRDGYIGRKRPLVKEVRVLFVPDGATVKAGLISGSIDVSGIKEDDVAELSKNPRLSVVTGTSPVRHGFIIQTRDPVMGNEKLRQAIAAAIDFKELVSAVTSDLGPPNNSPIYPTSRYFGPVQKQGFAYDPARAKKLLAEAGYKGEKIVMIANKRSTVPSFPSAVIAQQMLQAVGINVEIEVMEWATQLDRYNKGNYQMQSFSYSARVDPALGFEQIAGPKEKQPRKVWDVPADQALMDRSMQTVDVADRQQIFDTLHKRMLEHVPLIFTHNEVDCIAHNKRVVGLVPFLSKHRFWEVTVAN